jgi:hypothetical protein
MMLPSYQIIDVFEACLQAFNHSGRVQYRIMLESVDLNMHLLNGACLDEV